MRPLFEKVTVPEGASWALLDRRLDDGIPFQWHYHPEFELTLTLNSRGQRYIGDAISGYDDGDLVLLGPNLPHTWCSAEKLDAGAAAPRASSCGSPRRGRDPSPATFAEMRIVEPLLQRAGRGIAFSREARAGGAAAHRGDPGAVARRPAAPADAGAGAARRPTAERGRSPARGRPPAGRHARPRRDRARARPHPRALPRADRDRDARRRGGAQPLRLPPPLPPPHAAHARRATWRSSASARPARCSSIRRARSPTSPTRSATPTSPTSIASSAQGRA